MSLPKTPSFRLDGKRALVTGASRGIGLGCAVAMAEAGAHVVCVARGEAALTASVQAMTQAGLSAESLVLDITDVDAVRAAFETYGPIDIVINSAGLARHSALTETTPDDYDAVTDINVRAAYFVSQAAAKTMKANGAGGVILHISSQMGHIGGIDRAVYCGTKHALEGFVKAMAIELGPDRIRVNTICPTFIRTPLSAPTFADPERLKWIQEKIKLPRVGEVEDIMGACVFLASDAGSLVTGTSLLVDGGWTAG